MQPFTASQSNFNNQEMVNVEWLKAWQQQVSAYLPAAQQSIQNLPTDWMLPETFQRIQYEFKTQALELYQNNVKGHLAPIKDRRFAAHVWQESPSANLMANLYLLASSTLNKLSHSVDIPEATKTRLEFMTMQFVEAFAPTNFWALNPEAQKLMIDTQGKSLTTGLSHLFQDMSKKRISQTDEAQFVVGKNLATTPGSVIYENDLMQLIQYQASTSNTFHRPLLVVPPCINKYYILDLQPHNSMVKHLVDEGFTVFIISWRNPLASDSPSLAQKNWDDYIQDGVIQATDTVLAVTNSKTVNAVGFCIGGTMLSTAAAVLNAKKRKVYQSLTLLTTFLDFSEPGVLGMFIDDAHIQYREENLGQGGLLDGSELATTFSFLRPNELVWNYVVSNYLKGNKPPPFDMLYWNSDGTNLPGPFYVWYLKNTYHKNRLKRKGGVTVCGESLDLKSIDIPVYMYASREDHIVPSQAVYDGQKVVSGPVRFVMGASGHIAGVINPTASGKRQYWVGTGKNSKKTLDEWLAQASEHSGSWWPDWFAWLKEHSGRLQAAPSALGNQDFPTIEAAPGRYVQVRIS